MRRGTTPTHTFNVDVDLTGAEAVFVTYKQGSYTVLDKSIDQVDITEDKIEFTLTQLETLRFKVPLPVEIQIRARFPDGSAIASNIMETTAEKILKEGVI